MNPTDVPHPALDDLRQRLEEVETDLRQRIEEIESRIDNIAREKWEETTDIRQSLQQMSDRLSTPARREQWITEYELQQVRRRLLDYLGHEHGNLSLSSLVEMLLGEHERWWTRAAIDRLEGERRSAADRLVMTREQFNNALSIHDKNHPPSPSWTTTDVSGNRDSYNVDIVARVALARLALSAPEHLLWEDYPDLPEWAWEDVVNRVIKLAAVPDNDAFRRDYLKAYGSLAAQAEKEQ